jgi:hypothetical protein
MRFPSWEILPARGSHSLFVTGRSPRLALTLSGQIYMAKGLGSDLRPFVRDLHFDKRALHRHVLYPQAGALQREQSSAGARVLGKPGVQIYALRSINIIEETAM